MSGLSALATYDVSDDEENEKEERSSEKEEKTEEHPLEEEKKKTEEEIKQSREAAVASKQEKSLEDKEEIWDDQEPVDEDDQEEMNQEDKMDAGDEENRNDSIKDVEDLSAIHDESSLEMEAEESSGEEDAEVDNLKNQMKIQAKRRAKRKSSENATELAKKLRSSSGDEIEIPPEPEGRCSTQLQDKISRFFERKVKHGEDLNKSIQARKDFRNPSIYEKLILYLEIDELGTNFPKDDYNPKMWRKAPAYDELARAQREDMSKREKEKKTKVEFVTGTVKKPSTGQGAGGENVKKSKWDQQGHVSKSSDKMSASKSTVISAVGAIKKPKNC